MVDTVADLEFPIWGLLPKQETGITSFLNKYPEYDGRKINIAIFDSGVDPGAPGLQLTSTGERKIIARFDCSGCGDVNTSTIAQANEEGFITGLTGRKLKIPDAWLKSNKDFHIGVKNAFELYPSKLKERIENERKEKLWDVRHKVVVADATRELQKLENSSPKKNNHLSDTDVLLKEEHEYRVEFLNNLEKKYLDLGPVYDCVVFQDGDLWKACIDTTEEGDLANGILLAEYSKTFEFAPLTKADQLNISINVHDNGNVLEIVGLCSGHGTHVASIASAYFPNNPEKNGAAPGSQIISLTVGDGRLGSMETGTALVRAMIKVMELSKTDHPVHVINMSYGEHANWSNAGRIGDLMNEVVNKYGVVWVASAGNHGPALCTVGTPPDISQNTLIGVGAYVSPEMMVAEYSLRQKLPGMAYTWTSRGPTIDGDIGISICAPGAAITSVPNFTLRNAQLLNGTSMSAPHVGGAICILLSGLIQQNIAYSPYNVKRALENTARYLEHVDPFAQGHGLLQVEKAFEYLTNYHTCPATNVRFAVLCGNNGAKGIHLRKPSNQPIEYTVNIEPCFKDCEEIDPETKIKFGLHLALVSKSQYVQCPAFLDLQNLGRAINVKIDSAGLETGVHHTAIEAFDVSCVEKGPLFRVPITIIQPVSFELTSNMEMHFKGVTFKPNTIKRHFIQVPENATWGILRLRCTENGKQGRFVVHCMQILPKQSCKAQEFQKMSQVTSHSDTILGFQVKGGLILEVVVAKYWANLGDVVMDYSLIMHGIKPDCPSITMQAVDGLYEMEIRCLRMEEIAPIITLKSSVQALKPTDSKVSPLTARDIIPEGRQIYELVLTYEFHISKATEVVPNSPLLSDVLYESEFESQLWMLFDSNKQMLSCGDAYASKYIVKLERGDYVIKLHVRHDKKDLLEKLNDIPMLLSRKLSNSLSLDVYCNYAQAIIQGKKMISASVMKGATLPIYISPMFSDKSKLSSIQGQYLSGTITYAKDEYGKRVDTYPFKFIPTDPPKKSSSSSTKTEKEKTKLEEYIESLRDLKTSYLAKLDFSDQATTLYEEIKSAYPDHLAVHNAMMQCVDPIDVKKHLPLFDETQIQEQNKVTYNKIISLADIVINAVDIDKMLSMLAIKSDQRTDAAKIRTATEKQKAALLDALARKGIALCRLYLMDKNATTSDEMLDNIKSIWKDILKFIDPNDLKASAGNILYFAMWHAAVLQHYGRVLKYIGKLLEEKTQREIEEKSAEVCGILGWDHCVRYINKSLPIKYPANYRPF